MRFLNTAAMAAAERLVAELVEEMRGEVPERQAVAYLLRAAVLRHYAVCGFGETASSLDTMSDEVTSMGRYDMQVHLAVRKAKA